MKPKFTASLIRKTDRTNIPESRIYLDTETHIIEKGKFQDLPFRLAVTCYERVRPGVSEPTNEWRKHTNTSDLADYIISKAQQKRKLYIFTHNAEFDAIASGILTYMSEEGWVKTFYYCKGLIFILGAKKDKAKISIVSTTNYYPFALKALGDMIGLPKLDVDLSTEDQDTLFTYCRRDTEIVQKAMHIHFETVINDDLGNFKMTIPSQALAAYRHRFMRYKIYPHTFEHVKVMERNSYCGGRVECFHTGEYSDGPFVKLDFNSNYAYVMDKHAYPTKFLSEHGRMDIDYLSEILDYRCVCAEVVVNTDTPLYPVKYNGMLYFPIGLFKTTLNTCGLLEAIKRGHIVRINKVIAYEAKPIFKDYVAHFFALKQKYSREKNHILRTKNKLYLNSLYGKFAQRVEEIEEKTETGGEVCYRRNVFFMDNKEKVTETKLLNTVFHVTGKKDSKHTFTTISAHVTEYARFLLWSVIEAIGVDKVIYCDTDSVICRKKDITPVKHLIDSDKLGYLDIEKESESVNIITPKNYVIGEETKRKGIPKKHTYVGNDTYQYVSFLKFRSALIQGNLSRMYTKVMTKKLSCIYKKGKVDPSGKVSPFLLPDDAFLLS